MGRSAQRAMSIACSRIIDPGVAKAFEHSCIPIQAKRSCDEEEEWRRWHENAIATVSGEIQTLQVVLVHAVPPSSRIMLFLIVTSFYRLTCSMKYLACTPSWTTSLSF